MCIKVPSKSDLILQFTRHMTLKPTTLPLKPFNMNSLNISQSFILLLRILDIFPKVHTLIMMQFTRRSKNDESVLGFGF